ncbi:hypothetical protein C7M84_010939 [Penaeus vannamei]|uniref:Uncharacterized protein n=1 Tax=Penaeus vannamei TaxID=6689 RepID=A0A3R7M9I9_PENVA|nr:uncharacterized protein LOC113813051 [Penaeus vannamei]XP_027220785.1 uncharacterized protein LOC113813051 [Penaeus vannamei]XP_027220786.1 uncharacterized protein LOC113813051 [Penaeus vannamei]XP_027220787.1 uncharacterized protein LOC113813051 [Penaeus vannamei]XP_027220788.1 uncharacterized protein LOC113813051 [Penaeus vannamei]XP_027220789.1 uncharacterized protein LOC113813051 [Penaeus vannamei]ROT70761.1 hypothetical protein C7M84_010939 [Penaeus vannamei]
MEGGLRGWVERNSVPVRRESGFTVRELRTRTVLDDPTNKVRVLGVGPENGGEVKKVLLLGETGNGKSHLCNALVNRVFGVGLRDDVRLQLRDQMDEAGKSSTQSQTEYTTAYVIYRQEGMPRGHNLMVIDTAGVGDTGGRLREESNERQFRRCLAEHAWVRELSSVGLVWKASDHRYDQRKRDVLGRLKGLLGYDAKPITDVLVTFSTNGSRDAFDIMREAGVGFHGEFLFDNGPLYKGWPQDAMRRRKLEMEWEMMEESLDGFLEAVSERRAVELTATVGLIRSQFELEDTNAELQALWEQEDELRQTIREHERKLCRLDGKENEVDWDEVRALDSSREELVLENGQHCHYCPECDEVCVPSCSTDSTHERTGGVGEATNAGTTRVVCSFFKDGSLTCPECDHHQIDHEFRSKILVKDATFEQKLELVRKSQHERDIDQENAIRADIEAFEAQLKEIEEQSKVLIATWSRLEQRTRHLKSGN